VISERAIATDAAKVMPWEVGHYCRGMKAAIMITVSPYQDDYDYHHHHSHHHSYHYYHSSSSPYKQARR